MDTPSFETPTNDLRQVDMGGKTWAGYAVQRKWLVFDGVNPDPKTHFCGAMDGSTINNVKGHAVWRYLPTVTREQAKQDSTS